MEKKVVIYFASVIFIIFSLVIILMIFQNEKEIKSKAPSNSIISNNIDRETSYTNNLYEIDKYNVVHSDFTSTFVAPSYIDEELIAFEYDKSEQFKSYIATVSKKNQEYMRIYSTDEGKIINSMVGIDGTLYWVENDRDIHHDFNWYIKSIDLNTKEVKILRRGKLADQILPPVLRIYNNRITWIEKTLVNNKVYSTAILYDAIENSFSEIAKVRLDESTNREGKFMIIQRPIKDGMIIQQSVFNILDEESQKSLEIVYYPYDKTKSVLLGEGEKVVDFTANKDWFVWSEFGQINIVDRKTGEIKYTYKGKDKDFTFDSLFIINETLYFRYSMHQILQMNLQTGDVKEVTNSRIITSKIFNSNKYLGFSYMDAKESKGEVEFMILSQ
ncbi:hypothetical protein [Marinicrinis sediminis]|uniref:DUF5050 domain-containing protein n=1 Tax=Marinicrinis sediminis TaxID=1652465 RepID=A0ABW5R7F9_9BACL